MCFDKVGTILHVLLLALGLVKEHSRPDRDLFIRIIPENVRPEYWMNFRTYHRNHWKLLNDDFQHLPYDYGSVMHSGTQSFGRLDVTQGKTAATTIQPVGCNSDGVLVGQRTGLSHFDAFRVNKLYHCKASENACVDMEFNCARQGSKECKDPHDVYQGIKRTTLSGKSCQFWNAQGPHKHPYGNYYGESNYCRNPDGSKDAPWCYTMDEETEWEYCFPECATHSGVDKNPRNDAVNNKPAVKLLVASQAIRNKHGFLSPEDYENAALISTEPNTNSVKTSSNINSNYSHFEGDIVGITAETIEDQVELTNNADRFVDPLTAAKIGGGVAPERSLSSATNDPMKLWKDGIVPYAVYADYLSPAKALIAKAFLHIQQLTCIQFIKVNWLLHRDFIYLAPNGTGCTSFIGRQGGEQIVSLDGQCFDFDTVVHEIMHSLGFIHEHTRPDRDDYIEVLWANVEKDAYRNFKKYKLERISSLGAPYDYSSVMHYGSSDFAVDLTEDSLRTKNCTREGIQLGQSGQGLSYYDAYKINKLYNCSVEENDCVNITANCANAGNAACKNPNSYKRIKRTTVTGRTCQAWKVQYPHKHRYSTEREWGNFCRNPGGTEAAPWCLTVDPDTRWEYCFPQCDLPFGDLSVRLVYNDEQTNLPYGRIEVFYHGLWGTVAVDREESASWSSTLGSVVCRMLGWPSDNPVGYGSKKYGMGYGPVWIYSLSCDGSEHHIQSCSNLHIKNWRVRHSKDMGLHCACPNSKKLPVPESRLFAAF